MGKFRSKLKRNQKGKAWGMGQSASSNPENKTHRNKARSRFFQANLSLAPKTDPTATKKPNQLTLEALVKHDARQFYKTGKTSEPTVNDIATSLKSFDLNGAGRGFFGNDDDNGDDENMAGGTELGTFKTYKTFASSYSACTNMSFNKLLNGFRNDSQTHKEMLAILAAITDIIKEKGGTESSTEYFINLMSTLNAADKDNEILAAMSLLSMGIKTVPQAILRHQFSSTASTLLEIMNRYKDDDANINLLRPLLSCMSALLRAQEHSLWKLSSTKECFDSILPFVIHSKPKIRKSAQHAVTTILRASCFLLPTPNPDNTSDEINETIESKIKYHPVSDHLVKFCENNLKLDSSATIMLHTLGLLRDTLNTFKTEDMKRICEHLLSIMTAVNNVLVMTNCLHVIHSLFSSKSRNLTAQLTGKLISAIYEFRPDGTDVQQTLAWLTVLRQGHICLSNLDQTLCINSCPKLIELCAVHLWPLQSNEIVSAASQTIKEIFLECIQPGLGTKRLADTHQSAVLKCLEFTSKGLKLAFGFVVTQVYITYGTIFSVAGKWFGEKLVDALRTIANTYDSESSLRLQVEHTVLSAIPSMGPEWILTAIPLAQFNQDLTVKQMDLNKSWVLPLLREAIIESELNYFGTYILKLAVYCNQQWKQLKAGNNILAAHTHELLCAQLWGLFPGFCRKPKDLHKFGQIAKSLGNVLNQNPELRAPVLDGLKELLTNAEEDDGKQELAKFAKNFLPILLNIYSTKPTGSYENDTRKVTFEVIQEYLKITPQHELNDIYAKAQLHSQDPTNDSFKADCLYDIIELVAIYQSVDDLKSLFDDFILPVLQKSKKFGTDKMRQRKLERKAYQMLQNILLSDRMGCTEFVQTNLSEIQELILTTGVKRTTCAHTLAARLSCIKLLLENYATSIVLENTLTKKIIEEIIAALKHTASKKSSDNVSLKLIVKIGEMYQEQERLNDFVDIVLNVFQTNNSELSTNTILTLKSICSNFAGHLTVTNIEYILEQVLAYLVGKNRNEVEASIAFVITFIKVLPAPLVANHLPVIVRSLSSMVPDTKRYCRIHIGFVLKKLCKKFGAEEIIRFVPGNDEVTHKKLKNIRKEQNRLKRMKLARGDGGDDDSDDETNGLQKKSYTIDDILADSDSELEGSDIGDGNNNNDRAQKKSNKKQQTYIREDPESILDLTDVNAVGRITTNKPTAMITGNSLIDKEKKKKDMNRGFKTSNDGRLIIAEPKRGSGGAGDSSDSDDGDGGGDQSKKIDNESKKRSHDEDDDDDDDSDDETAQAMKLQSRKRKAIDSHSAASGRTGTTGKYTAGGKGIHRPVAASVANGNSSKAMSAKSGMSRMSMATTKSAASTAYGSSYKAKKAKGDMKKKGQVDPYAYIQLNRSSLNKRQRVKSGGQFKGLVGGGGKARKGNAAGNKNRVQKTYKK